ncbi:hypothetical protein [Spongiimicrobium salis]|uniref:hypothetical protein n=1 Tax=Spongiimicrobium salis TaxID=1667022 RepID=UPI00374C9467
MNWKKTYALILSFLILDLIIGFTMYSSEGFTLTFRSFQILPTLLIGLHIFFIVVLNKAITVEKRAHQRLKVLEYINYVVVGFYIFWFLSKTYHFISWGYRTYGTDTPLLIYVIVTWIINGIIIFLTFKTYQLRKQSLGKYSEMGALSEIQSNPQEALINHSFTTNEERLALCKVCTNRQFNMEKGLLCSLNQEKPSFSSFCIDYYVDEKEQQRQIALNPPKSKKGFFGSWKAALLMSILGFARAAMRGFTEPMGLIFLALGIGWLLLAAFGSNKQE